MATNEIRQAVDALVNILYLIRQQSGSGEAVRRLADLADEPLRRLVAAAESEEPF